MTRTEWILGILLAILLFFVVILGIIFWLQPGNNGRVEEVPVAPTSSFSGQTALQAFLFAQAEAASWQSDAALLKATATWPQGSDRATLLSGKSTWNFTYYSAAAQLTIVVSLVEEEATLGTTRPVDAAFSPVSASNVKLDSHEAIQALLNAGGAEFMDQHGVTTLTATLSTDTAENRVEWFLSLFSVGDGKSFTAFIDAASGEIINLIETP
jgi:hypothetical protein